MRISALEEYGIRCALQLAREYETGPFPASQIAKHEEISPEYVGKIMHLFRKAGVVRAERGNQGGFVLKAAPEKVTLKQIFDSLREKKETESFCEQYTGKAEQCVHHADCGIRPVWQVLNSYFDDVLDSLTLQDLLMKEQKSRQRVEGLASEKADVARKRVVLKV